MEFVVGLLPLVILGGLVFAVVNGLRTSTSDASDPIDATEVAKSFALHVGLFVALIAASVGTIDVLQSLVEEGDRLAGSNSDLARGLSLLLVAGPAFALLLRPISRRCLERRAAIGRSTRGWSLYLLAALSTSLIATLTSVAQITEDLTRDSGAVEPSEVMQLFVWFAVWLLHWFVMRPWLGVRNQGHVAVGTIVGLAWMLSGVAAVTYRVLAAGYNATFESTLDDSFDLTFWIVIAIVGAVVWAWHWLMTFNASDPSKLVEGAGRGSAFWFFTVVVAGVLPGLIAMLATVTAMISGTLIWFLGTTNEDAADFFEPAPALSAALFIALVTWAYHRWQLERFADEQEGGRVRNEALRFHDYVVVATGLVAVVGAVASLVALFFDTIVSQSLFADSSRSDNALIIIVTVLCAGGVVWWRYWSLIEVERTSDPIDECDSFWRKLYLITGFGVGGLVLAVSLTWVIFAFLRDLLDGVLGRSTVEDLANPIGWAIAVVGGVWYHFGVWKADRAVLADRPPPPPEPVASVAPGTTTPPPPPLASQTVAPVAQVMTARPATTADTGELFTLQQADRGDRLATAASVVEPVETFAQMQERLAVSTTTVVVDRGRIVGFAARPTDAAKASAVQVVIAPDRSSAEILALLRG